MGKTKQNNKENISNNLITFNYYKKIKEFKENTKETNLLLEKIANIIKDIPNTYKKVNQKNINVWEIQITNHTNEKKGIIYLLNDNSIVWNYYEKNILLKNQEIKNIELLNLETKLDSFLKLF